MITEWQHRVWACPAIPEFQIHQEISNQSVTGDDWIHDMLQPIEQTCLLVDNQQHGDVSLLGTEYTPSGSDDGLVPSSQLHQSNGDFFVPIQNDAAPLPAQSQQQGTASSQKKASRGRPGTQYESLIDPSLPEHEKKKFRRLMSNRASAKRARERKAKLVVGLKDQLENSQERVSELEAYINILNKANRELKKQVKSLQKQLPRKDGE